MEQSQLTFTWRKGPNAPSKMFTGSCAVHGTKAYFSGWCSRVVYEFDSETGGWSTLPDCPHRDFSLVIVDGLLTAVGGDDSWMGRTNKLLSYKDNNWVEHFPSMPAKRSTTAVACNGSVLVVMGGFKGSKKLETVEIMDVKSQKWFTAAPLPFGITGGRACIIGDALYIMAGDTTSSFWYDKVVSTCSLRALVQSDTPDAAINVWQKTSDLPVDSAYCVSIKGQLLAVGGVDMKYDQMTPIRSYNPVCNSWNTVSHMTIGRNNCMAVVLPGDQLMVVGGRINAQGHDTDEVEIATVV